MGYMQEYIDKIKTMPLQDLEKELQQLIGQFNEKFDCELVLFITDLEKNVQEVALTNADYEVLYDMLLDKTGNRVVTFLETPGGSGDAAQNIARMLDNKYNEVNFLIAGEAKSAGTILALSGDEILMTESGSLGPIDAQMTIGRSTVSAHDYISWVNDKRNEAKEEGRLNPFDAVIAAQINPGELRGVHNAYYFAIDFDCQRSSKYIPVTSSSWEKSENILSVCHWNCHLTTSYNDILHLLDLTNSYFDVIGFCETFLTSEHFLPSFQLTVPGLQLYQDNLQSLNWHHLQYHPGEILLDLKQQPVNFQRSCHHLIR